MTETKEEHDIYHELGLSSDDINPRKIIDNLLGELRASMLDLKNCDERLAPILADRERAAKRVQTIQARLGIENRLEVGQVRVTNTPSLSKAVAKKVDDGRGFPKGGDMQLAKDRAAKRILYMKQYLRGGKKATPAQLCEVLTRALGAEIATNPANIRSQLVSHGTLFESVPDERGYYRLTARADNPEGADDRTMSARGQALG